MSLISASFFAAYLLLGKSTSSWAESEILVKLFSPLKGMLLGYYSSTWTSLLEECCLGMLS